MVWPKADSRSRSDIFGIWNNLKQWTMVGAWKRGGLWWEDDMCLSKGMVKEIEETEHRRMILAEDIHT